MVQFAVFVVTGQAAQRTTDSGTITTPLSDNKTPSVTTLHEASSAATGVFHCLA